MIQIDTTKTKTRILVDGVHIKTASLEFAKMAERVGEVPFDTSKKRLNQTERAYLIANDLKARLESSEAIFDRALYDSIKNREYLGFVLINKREVGKTVCVNFGGIKVPVPMRYMKYLDSIIITENTL